MLALHSAITFMIAISCSRTLQKKRIDANTKELLRFLQENPEIPTAKLAEALHLLPTPCWRRVQRLKDEGVIARQLTLLAPRKLDLEPTAFVCVRTNEHGRTWFDKSFRSAVREMPDAVEFYRMNGDIGDLLREVVSGIADYDEIHMRLTRASELFGSARVSPWRRSNSPPRCRWRLRQPARPRPCRFTRPHPMRGGGHAAQSLHPPPGSPRSTRQAHGHGRAPQAVRTRQVRDAAGDPGQPTPRAGLARLSTSFALGSACANDPSSLMKGATVAARAW